MSGGDHDSDDLDWDEVAPVPDESEGCFATVPEQEIAKPKRSFDLPHPSKCTKEQHLLAAYFMRERKAMMRASTQRCCSTSWFWCFAGQMCENQAGQRRRWHCPQPPSIWPTRNKLAKQTCRRPSTARGCCTGLLHQ